MKVVPIHAHLVSVQLQTRFLTVCRVRYHLCIHVLFNLIVALVTDHLVLRHQNIEIVLLSYTAVHLHDLHIRHPLRRQRPKGMNIRCLFIFLLVL